MPFRLQIDVYRYIKANTVEWLDEHSYTQPIPLISAMSPKRGWNPPYIHVPHSLPTSSDLSFHRLALFLVHGRWLLNSYSIEPKNSHLALEINKQISCNKYIEIVHPFSLQACESMYEHPVNCFYVNIHHLKWFPNSAWLRQYPVPQLKSNSEPFVGKHIHTINHWPASSFIIQHY